MAIHILWIRQINLFNIDIWTAYSELTASITPEYVDAGEKVVFTCIETNKGHYQNVAWSSSQHSGCPRDCYFDDGGCANFRQKVGQCWCDGVLNDGSNYYGCEYGSNVTFELLNVDVHNAGPWTCRYAQGGEMTVTLNIFCKYFGVLLFN